MFKKLLVVTLLLFTAHFSEAQYCSPTYTNACSSNDFINNFSTTGGVSNISNLNSGCNGGAPNNYTFFPQTVSQMQGLSFSFTLQSGSSWSQGFRIWVDWNQDLDFADPGEDVYVSPASSTSAYNATITVPITATPGNTRMRVMCTFANIPLVTDYCSTSLSFGETEDYTMQVISAVPCTGQPVAGTVTPAATVICAGQNINLTATGTTLAGNMSYQWQESTNGGISWSNATGGFGSNSPNYQTPGLTASIVYRMYIICNTSGLSDTSSISNLTVSGPTYVALPYVQSFENWTNYCSTNDVPDDNHWSNNPSTGDNSWRRDDDGASGNWLYPTSGSYLPTATVGNHSARIHSYVTNLSGDLDLYLDCSLQTGTKTLFFDYINDNSSGFGSDYLEVLLSTNAGATFSSIGVFNNSVTWQNFSASIVSNSPNTVLRFRGYGDFQYDTDLGIDNIAVLSPCTGTPVAGAIDSITPCANVPFNLTLTGNVPAGGLGYTWESAPTATGPWTFVNTTSGPVVNTQIGAPTWFRCIVNCPNSGLSDTAAPKFIDLATFYYCYCTSSAQGSWAFQNIGNVTIKNAQAVTLLNNGNAAPLLGNTSPINFNQNYTYLTPTDMYRDSTYDISITCFAQSNFYYNSYANVFIDYNRDGVYDPILELVGGGAVNSPNQDMTTTITVPSTASFGWTGMRIVYQVFGSAASTTSCGTYGDGETEDYLVNLSLPPCLTPPNPGVASINDTATCPGYSIFLQDIGHDAIFYGLTFNWQFSNDGVNYSDISGATLDTLTYIVNNNMWFRFRTTCNGTSSAYSNVVKVVMNPPFACYGPSQAIGGSLDSSDVGAVIIADPASNNNIYSFITGGPHLLNPTAIRTRTDRTSLGAMDLFTDSTYQISINHIMRSATHADAKITVFIDYNNNQLYDIPQERVYSGISDISTYYLVGSFHTPVLPALNTATGMRVILNNNLTPNSASDNGVGLYTSGETEDYLVRFKLKQLGPNGVQDLSVLDNVGVYPNPTSGMVYIGLEAKEPTAISISLMSITGATLFEKNLGKVNGSFVTELDLASYAKGTYMIKITSDKGNFVRRVVVQ